MQSPMGKHRLLTSPFVFALSRRSHKNRLEFWCWEILMTTITIEVPDDVFPALRRSPDEFGREMLKAAAIQWYSQGLISQGKAAEIAGLSPDRLSVQPGPCQGRRVADRSPRN